MWYPACSSSWISVDLHARSDHKGATLLNTGLFWTCHGCSEQFDGLTPPPSLHACSTEIHRRNAKSCGPRQVLKQKRKRHATYRHASRAPASLHGSASDPNNPYTTLSTSNQQCLEWLGRLGSCFRLLPFSLHRWQVLALMRALRRTWWV